MIKAALARAKVDPAQVSEVIMGQVLAAGVGQNPARQALLKAGLPKEVPGLTINAVCGSGLKAVMLAAQAIAWGDAEIVVAGGQENMSAAPHVLPNSRDGQRMGDWKLVDTMIVDGLWDVYNQYHMGITAENVAKLHSISREAQDALALASQQKAAAAQEAGTFKDEIVPVSIPQRKGDPMVFDTDEYVNKKTNAEALAGLRPAFDKAGSVTAGNASGINDGAAAVVVMSAKKAAELGLKPLARIAAFATSGLDPATMGMGPVPATRKALQRAGWKAGDVNLFELNEAFAAQACAVNKELGIDSVERQRQRRRHRHRAPDRCVRLPHPGDAAARDAAARSQEGHRRAVHRRRHGGFPRCRTRLTRVKGCRGGVASGAMRSQFRSTISRRINMSQKIAYVTGGMGGIGTAICQRLHKEGFKVIAGCGPTRDFGKWLGEQKALGYHLLRVGRQCRRLEFHRRRLQQGQGRTRRHRRAGQQRRHHARPHVPEDDPRGLGRGDRDQPQLDVQRHQAGGGRHGREGLGPHHQHQLGQRRKGPGRPDQLLRRQGRHARLHHGAGAGDWRPRA